MKISVIVPIYNAEKYIDGCIKSVIGQTYDNLEIILIDDGSKDNSAKKCMDYQNQDFRIKLIRRDKNFGLVSGRRLGMEMASGDYVTFVDADDYIDLDYCERIMNELENRTPDMVMYNLIEEFPDRMIEKKNVFVSGVYKKNKIRSEVLPAMMSVGDFHQFGVLPNVCCKLINKKFYELVKDNIWVDDQIRIGEDAALTYQLLVNANEIQFVDFAPYHYIRYENSMMSQRIKYEEIRKLEKNISDGFLKAGVNRLMEKSLQEYITFITLLKCPERVNEIRECICGQRIVIYGFGGFGQALYQSYREEVIFLTDSNWKRYINSNPVIVDSCELLKRKEEYDKIFIAVLDVRICKEIKDNLRNMGVEKPICYYGQ